MAPELGATVCIFIKVSQICVHFGVYKSNSILLSAHHCAPSKGLSPHCSLSCFRGSIFLFLSLSLENVTLVITTATWLSRTPQSLELALSTLLRAQLTTRSLCDDFRFHQPMDNALLQISSCGHQEHSQRLLPDFPLPLNPTIHSLSIS